MNRDDLIREIQARYRESGASLNELQRRHWAAMEALKLGRGAITIVSKALRISPNTIKKGIQELATDQAGSFATENSRIRRPGGGRKSKHTQSDQFARTRSKKVTAAMEREFQAIGDSAEGRHDKLPVASDMNLIPVESNATGVSPDMRDEL